SQEYRMLRARVYLAGDRQHRPLTRSVSDPSKRFHPVGYNGCNMPQTSTRDRIMAALRDLPEDATFEDAIERLVFLAKIDVGLGELDAAKGIPHEEVKRRLGL